MKRPDPITLLHVSDLHFGRHHRFSSDDGPHSLLEMLRIDLDALRQQEGMAPDLLIISGDLAEYGDSEELDRATSFLQKLAQSVELPSNRVVIVPGNHDINWHLSESYFSRCKAFKKTPQRPYFEKFAFYREAFNKFYAGFDGITFTEKEPWSFFEYPELGVVVAGMNSTIAESHTDHFGFLGNEQLRWFAAKLRPYKERGFWRIGVMHHDPRDRRGGVETQHDQADLRRLLAPSLNLLLHGDIHEDTNEVLHNNVPVFGIGSLGVKSEQRPEEVPNVYQLLQLYPHGVRRALRAYTPDRRRFFPSARADADGKSILVESPYTFENIQAFRQTNTTKHQADLGELVELYRRSMENDQRMYTVGDLLGRDVSGGPMAAIDVLRLFVPQNVTREEPIRELYRGSWRERMDLDDVSRDGTMKREPLDGREPREPFPMRGFANTITDALARGWVYLLGAPGAGKTALTRWILLSLSVPGERIEGFSDDLVPVRIDMRWFDEAHRNAAGPYSFLDHIDKMLAERHLNLRGEPLRALAHAGRLYFLFDGLDEVLDPARRRHYAGMIADLARSTDVGRCQGVVTSRIVGAEVAQSIFAGAGFETYRLCDFTEAQQDRFLNTWHDLVFAREPHLLTHRRQRMARALAASPSLRMLCGNPLCCSLLAYLNRDEELPEGRHGLYQRILEQLAERWDANKGWPAQATSLRFDLSDKLLFLKRLGWEMMNAGGAEAGNAIAEGDLVKHAQRFCEQRWSETSDGARRRAEALIRDLRERNEVLAWLGGDLYGFSHRALLEVSAAARAIEMHGRPEAIAKLGAWFYEHWRQDGWEETLLLTCGLLREVEQGPVLVVRLLQEMAQGNRAAVVHNLDEYLPFCIKALGELRTLEKGLPLEFAEEINGVLECMMRSEPPRFSQYRYAEPFLRCAGKWPDVDRLMRVTEERFDFLDDAIPLWIVAAGRAGRTRMLERALDVYRAKRGTEHDTLPWMWCREAARLGPWSREEVTRLCDMVERLAHTDQDRYNVLSEVVETPGMVFREDDRLIQTLVHVMQAPTKVWVQQASAYCLARMGMHRDTAVAKLRTFLDSDQDFYRHHAARYLCLLGHHPEALDILLEGAQNNETPLSMLLDLAGKNQQAAEALRKLVPTLQQHADMRVLVNSFKVAERHGYELISKEDLSRRLREQNADDAENYLHLLSLDRELSAFLAREYASLLRRTDYVIDWHVWDILHLEPKHGGKDLHDVWAMLLEAKDRSVVRNTAHRIIHQSAYPDLIASAREKMLHALATEQDEENRFYATTALGVDEPAARQVYEELAESATNEWIRQHAATAIGNVRALAHLAERTAREDTRRSARETLDLYAHVHRLLSIGRPRRADVKLHGLHAGVLEEIAFQGGTRFIYDKAYRENPGAKPLAPNLPLREQAYEAPTTLHPFFANLLPEGSLLDQTARRLGLPKTDRFGILLQVGEDVMGAVQVLPEETN